MSIKLVSERLCMKPFKKEDANSIKELANDKELADILGLPHPYELRFAEEWIANQPELIKNGTEYPLKIISKDIQAIIGTITLRVDKANHRGELGYWMGQKYWGNGFATEAVRSMIEFGFVELGLNRIWATVISRNKNSINVLEKSGLLKEGTLRKNRLLSGIYEDVNVYGILKSDYLP